MTRASDVTNDRDTNAQCDDEVGNQHDHHFLDSVTLI